MRKKYRTRRDFLWRGGLAASGVAASRLFAQTSGLRAVSFRNVEEMRGAQVESRLRGLMVDAGRVPEALEYYKRVIDFCTDWEFNALQFRLADDQGCAMRFSSVPDLLFHENAFTPEQLGGLAEYARSRHVDLIPELESFGHTGYITRSAAYAHLLDADSQGSSEFTGVIPVHPETLALFDKLYREISAVFPSSFIHGGCDEVNWGGSSLSRKALQTKQRYQIWAEYLNSLHQLAERLTRRFIVWGDVVVHNEPKILNELSKNIIVMDWNYRETDSAKIHDTLSKIHANGSRAIGGPALINYRWGPRAGRDQLANIDAFTDAYLEGEDSGSLGVILTNWVPSRYVQNSIWDGFAYAAVGFKEGSSVAKKSGFRRFVERHYGASWNNEWAEAFGIIYDNAPRVEERKTTTEGVPLHVPWSDDEELAKVLEDRSIRSVAFTGLRKLLVQLEKRVSKNRTDFQAFALSVAYLEHLYWRESIVVESHGRKSLTREDAALLIKNIADRDRNLAETLSKDWDRGRFADSAAKLKPLYGMQPKDQLVFQFERAMKYSTSLALHPDRFFELLTASRSA